MCVCVCVCLSVCGRGVCEMHGWVMECACVCVIAARSGESQHDNGGEGVCSRALPRGGHLGEGGRRWDARGEVRREKCFNVVLKIIFLTLKWVFKC